jgi:hypothetical protein
MCLILSTACSYGKRNTQTTKRILHLVLTLWDLMVPLYITRFKVLKFCIVPAQYNMCFVWISEQTAIISLYSINWLVCISETECVYCAVRAEPLNIIQVRFRYWRVNIYIEREKLQESGQHVSGNLYLYGIVRVTAVLQWHSIAMSEHAYVDTSSHVVVVLMWF